MYESKEECKEDGGKWDKAKEVCSLDLEFDTSTSSTGDRYETETTVPAAILVLSGAILTVPLITSFIGVPLLIYGLARLSHPNNKAQALIIFGVGTIIFYILTGVFLFFFGTQILPQIVQGFMESIPEIPEFPSPS